MAKKRKRPIWTYNEAETQDHVSRQKDIREPIQGWQEGHSNKKVQDRREALVFADNPAYSVAMRLCVAGTGDTIDSYRGAFLLDDQRIRGIDYTPVKVTRFYNEADVKEQGWHENVLYYDLSEGKMVNEHHYFEEEELAPWVTRDLTGFFDFCCTRWNINQPEEERRLL